MNKRLLHDLIERLRCEPYFQDFSFRKRDNTLIKSIPGGYEAIEFQFWSGYDLAADCEAFVIRPLYLKRFDVLHEWFEKFSFKSIRDQRDSYTVGFDGEMLNSVNEFYFWPDKLNYESEFNKLKSVLIANAETVFTQFATLQQLYSYTIIPILDFTKELPNSGADWAFEYLKLTKMVDPDNYPLLKQLILKRVDEMNLKREPNIIEYHDKLGMIISEIESPSPEQGN